jgi:hydroxymethylbilane synthase
MTTLRLGTRGSQLALWQANEVARQLREIGVTTEIRIIKTTGDKRHDVSLATIGGKGLFIKEIEEALDRREIDFAVHSLKDVPSIVEERFVLAGFLERADPRDVWIHPDGKSIDEIPAGGTIGTSSPRRRAQLAILYPKLQSREIRGNVDTRVAKARSGEFSGIVLASAGLTRLGRQSDITSYFPVDEMVPAVGQGIVAIETLASRDDVRATIARISHRETALAANLERGTLIRFGTRLDCYSAIAVHGTFSNGTAHLDAFLSAYDGTRSIRAQTSGPDSDVDALTTAMHRELVDRGGLALLESHT